MTRSRRTRLPSVRQCLRLTMSSDKHANYRHGIYLCNLWMYDWNNQDAIIVAVHWFCHSGAVSCHHVVARRHCADPLSRFVSTYPTEASTCAQRERVTFKISPSKCEWRMERFGYHHAPTSGYTLKSRCMLGVFVQSSNRA
jgi:hypothetical protein